MGTSKIISDGRNHRYEDVSGTESILLVEDNDIVCEFATSSLRENGYTVETAISAEESIAAFEKMKGVRLLITDIVLPKANGFELANQLCERDPQLKVLYVSGYIEESIHGRNVINEGGNFLRKTLHRARPAPLRAEPPRWNPLMD